MSFLRDRTLERLREVLVEPDLSGTRYRLQRRVARGGMGVVYAAEDVVLERRVALKVLEIPCGDGELAGRLLREAQVLAKLEHPGIVPVHDVGTLADGRVFYTMKFVEGERLDRHIECVPSQPDRLRLFLRVCDAVAFAHARGILHRDLKPSNIMVGSFGEVLVMDWGLAKLLKSEAGGRAGCADSGAAGFGDSGAPPAPDDTVGFSEPTAKGRVMGTPGYMSPEQARGEVQHLDARSDIYALGVILRFLTANARVKPARRGEKTISRPLAAICSMATAEDPAKRYPSVPELARDVARYVDGLAVDAYRENIVEKAGRFYRKYRFFILLIAAYLLMRILLLVFSHHQP